MVYTGWFLNRYRYGLALNRAGQFVHVDPDRSRYWNRVCKDRRHGKTRDVSQFSRKNNVHGQGH